MVFLARIYNGSWGPIITAPGSNSACESVCCLFFTACDFQTRVNSRERSLPPAFLHHKLLRIPSENQRITIIYTPWSKHNRTRIFCTSVFLSFPFDFTRRRSISSVRCKGAAELGRRASLWPIDTRATDWNGHYYYRGGRRPPTLCEKKPHWCRCSCSPRSAADRSSPSGGRASTSDGCFDPSASTS